MKTLEVMEKVLRGKRMSYQTKKKMELTMRRFAEYSPEFPENGTVINEWLAGLEIADITAENYYRILRMAGEYMRKAYDLKNPTDTAERPRKTKSKRRYFTPDEELRIIAACRYEYDRELVLTLADSLCRIGELGYEKNDPIRHPGLKGEDIADGYITVKGKTGERIYRLDIRICQALKQLAINPDDYVFKNGLGNGMSTEALQMRVRRIVRRAGITGKKLGAHSLRHAGGSLIAKATMNPFAVKQLLQHDDIESSMEYIHDVEEEAVRNVVSPLQLLSEAAIKGDIKVDVVQGAFVEDGESTALVPLERNINDFETSTLEDDIFPKPKEGIEIRPLLKTDDIRLLRRMMVVCFNTEIGKQDALQGRELMKRILRKVK